MSINIVTTYPPKNDNEMGKRFVSNFIEFWPDECVLYAGYEDENNIVHPNAKERIKVTQEKTVSFFNLFDSWECWNFIKSNKGEKVVRGLQSHAWYAWRPEEIEEGYSFRYDAYKFCRKVYAMNHIIKILDDGDVLFWVDADIVTNKKFSKDVLDEMLPKDKALSFLYRHGIYTETGFIGFRVNAQTRKLLAEMERTYSEVRFLYYSQWHDCMVFDVLKDAVVEVCDQYRIPSLYDLHPFETSPLSPYATHLKGDRKSK